MDIFDFFYESTKQKEKLLPRKLQLPKQNLFLQGIKFCGKYSLLLQSLTPNTLLIDASDLRFDMEYYNKYIDSFLEQKKIDLLILYNYKPKMRVPSSLPTILSATSAIHNPGFPLLRLHPLDFEEFILFDKSHHDIKVVFNNYLKAGTMPQMAQLSEFARRRRYQEMIALIFPDPVDLYAFKEIAFFQSTAASAHFIYTRVKSKIKISKDRFYALFHRLKDEGYLFAVPKLGSKRAAPKLFFYDFTLKSQLYTQKEFPKIFENMVFWQIKHKNLAYVEPLGLLDLDEELLVLPIPFGNEVKIEDKIGKILKKNKIQPKRIEVVSVGSTFSYLHEEIPCEVVPFYEWALR